LSAQAVSGVAFMMPEDKDTYSIWFDTVEQVIGKTVQINAPDALPEKWKLLRITSNLMNLGCQLIEKLIRKCATSLFFVK
jgi:hypothetical protein